MDTPASAEAGPLDLPLFEEPIAPEPPPVAIPPAGPPLSVRRKIEIARTPTRGTRARPRADPAASAFEWPDEPSSQQPAIAPRSRTSSTTAPSRRAGRARPRWAVDCGPGIIDVAVLVATDAARAVADDARRRRVARGVAPAAGGAARRLPVPARHGLSRHVHRGFRSDDRQDAHRAARRVRRVVPGPVRACRAAQRRAAAVRDPGRARPAAPVSRSRAPRRPRSPRRHARRAAA